MQTEEKLILPFVGFEHKDTILVPSQEKQYSVSRQNSGQTGKCQNQGFPIVPYLANTIMISLLLATNLLISSADKGACWSFARS